jgi:hypothetical protein
MTLLYIILGLVALGSAAVVLIRRNGKFFQTKIGGIFQAQFQKQLEEKYPRLAERLKDYDLSADSQETFQAAARRIAPQEGIKVQTEFNRLKDKFFERHPDLLTTLNQLQTTDPKNQHQTLQGFLKLPDEKRSKIETDVLYAWDELRKRFPVAVAQLEAALKKKNN